MHGLPTKRHFTYGRLVWFPRMMEGAFEPTALWAVIVLLVYPEGVPCWCLHLLPLALLLLKLDEFRFYREQPKGLAVEDRKVMLLWSDRQASFDAGELHGEVYRLPKKWNRPVLTLVTPEGRYFFFRGLQDREDLLRTLETAGARLERLTD